MLNCRFRLNNQPVSELIVDGIGSFRAFSGNDGFRNSLAAQCLEDIGPLPLGRYYVLDRVNGGRAKFFKDLIGYRSDWFVLYAIDNDVDDVMWCDEVARGKFRLHYGGNSDGCITVIDRAQYTMLHDMIKSYGASPVEGGKFNAYGILEVVI